MLVTVEREEDGLCRVAVNGEMTIYAAQELKDELLSPLAQCETVEVNLAGVSEIDSAGLQLLVMAKVEAQTRGKTLSLTGHSPAVLEILNLCDLEGFFGDTVLIHSQE